MAKTKKKPAKRGPRSISVGEPMSEQVMIRVLPSQLKKWHKAAQVDNRPLGQWIRNIVERALGALAVLLVLVGTAHADRVDVKLTGRILSWSGIAIADDGTVTGQGGGGCYETTINTYATGTFSETTPC